MLPSIFDELRPEIQDLYIGYATTLSLIARKMVKMGRDYEAGLAAQLAATWYYNAYPQERDKADGSK